MKKLLFAHDHIFSKVEETYYSSGGLSAPMLQRYISVFDNITVVSRQRELLESIDNLSVASTPGATFVRVPDFKNPKKALDVFKAKEIIKNEVMSSDFIIVRLPSSIGSIAFNYAKKHKKPILVEVVGCAWDAYFNHSIVGKIIAPFTFFSMKRKVGQSKYAIYVTKEFLQKRYPTRRHNTNCSNVALPDIPESILIERLDKISRYDSEKTTQIATVAAVNVKYKGQQFVIRAIGEMKKNGIKNINYNIIGSGNNQYLKEQAIKFGVQDQVKFYGNLPHHLVFDELTKQDLYIQPSKQEGLPRALIEAMAMGLPSMGAATAGIPELIDSNYVFSNSRNNYKEIAILLSSISKQEMLRLSKENFYESKKYSATLIEERRNRFLKEFKKTGEII